MFGLISICVKYIVELLFAIISVEETLIIWSHHGDATIPIAIAIAAIAFLYSDYEEFVSA